MNTEETNLEAGKFIKEIFMGVLKLKEKHLSSKTAQIITVLNYFASKELKISKEIAQRISAAADNAYTDPILFEEFENWIQNKNDETFLYLINHYWETKNKTILIESERDITGKDNEIQAIKSSAKKEAGKNFAQLLNKLANSRSLKTNEEIGKFLGVSGERIRVMLEGIHKPQRATLLLISEKFGISPENLQRELRL